MHRHHLRYKSPQIIVMIPGWYHWLIHCPAALIFWPVTQHEWNKPRGKGHAIRAQNKAARAMGVRPILGYPNPFQFILKVIAWIIWGGGWIVGVGVAMALLIVL